MPIQIRVFTLYTATDDMQCTLRKMLWHFVFLLLWQYRKIFCIQKLIQNYAVRLKAAAVDCEPINGFLIVSCSIN